MAHSRALRVLAGRLLQDEHGAEDLVQDTLVVALEQGVPARHRPAAWLSGILRNLFRMSVRTDSRRRRREGRAEPRAASDPVEVAIRLEAQSSLLDAVRALPEPYRGTVVARFFDERSAEEVARDEGVPASTVRTRTRRGLAMLRERLDRESGSRRAWILALLPVARSPGPAAGVASGIAKGVVIMSAKKAILAGVAVAALAALGMVALLTSTEGEPPSSPTRRGGATAAPAKRDSAAVNGTAAPGPDGSPVDLAAADRDLDLFGRVTDPEGIPVAGAALDALGYPWRRAEVLNVEGHDEVRVVESGRSARDGSFSLRLTRGRLVDLRVRAGGFAETTVPRCQAGERIDVVLGRGAVYLVRCVDEAGAPVAGVALTVRRHPESRRPVLDRRGVTDERGEILFAGMTPGPVSVLAVHPGHGVPDGRAPDVPVEGRAVFVLTLFAGRTIHGRVVDAADGSPIAGARVGESWPLLRSVRTDGDGRFTIDGWIDGEWRDLHVLAQGYGRQQRRVPTEGEVEFALHRGDEVVGRLVDRRGRPVDGARVSAIASDTGGPTNQEIDTRSGRSGPEGRFRLGSLRRDIGEHRLVVVAEGFGKLLRSFAPAADGPGTIDLGDVVLHPGHAIEGRVVDGDGQPRPDVRTLLQSDGASISRWAPYGDREDRRTDDLGRFRFPDLAAGKYEIRVKVPGLDWARRNVDLPGDRDVTGVTIPILDPGSREGRTVHVRVVDETGAPVAGVFLAPIATRARGAPVRSDADGRGIVRGIPREETWVSALVPVGMEFVAGDPVRVAPGEGEVTLSVRRAAMLRGVVVRPDGTPLPRIRVQAFPRGDIQPRWSAMTDESGAFAIRTVPGSVVDLVVDGSRTNRPGEPRLAVRGEISGVAGPRDGLVLRTTPVTEDRVLTVRALDPGGRPVEGARLVLRVRGETRDLRTGPDGRASFADLPSDTVSVRILPGTAAIPETAVDPEAFRVVPDGQEVVVRFRRGALVKGVVLGPDDAPIPGAEVKIMGPAGFERSGRTDAEGRFSLPGVPGAAHQVWARHRTDERVLAGIVACIRTDGREVVLELKSLSK